MSNDQNIALMRRYFEECIAGGDSGERPALALVDELLSPDFVMSYNNQSDAQSMRGSESHKAFLARHARNYPNDRWSIEAIVADDTTVACQWRLQCTHAESGNPIDIRAADFFTVRDGRLTDLRRFLDFYDLNRQKQPVEGQTQARS